MKVARDAYNWDRSDDEWYVEPSDCTTALLRVEAFNGRIWDPACGCGNIARAVQSAGLECFTSDIVNRGRAGVSPDSFLQRDFLYMPTGKFPARNIITNPPFARGVLTEAFR
jgi:hypothetical protein